MFGGASVLLLGVLGYVGVFSKENTPWFWMDPAENFGHTLVGVLALAAAAQADRRRTTDTRRVRRGSAGAAGIQAGMGSCPAAS